MQKRPGKFMVRPEFQQLSCVLAGSSRELEPLSTQDKPFESGWIVTICDVLGICQLLKRIRKFLGTTCSAAGQETNKRYAGNQS
jgi:hypothetical protein